MYTIKDKNAHLITNAYAIKNQAIQTITNIYAKIGNSIVLVWTAIKDYISGVFGGGFWNNEESWNNEELWKNEP